MLTKEHVPANSTIPTDRLVLIASGRGERLWGVGLYRGLVYRGNQGHWRWFVSRVLQDWRNAKTRIRRGTKPTLKAAQKECLDHLAEVAGIVIQ